MTSYLYHDDFLPDDANLQPPDSEKARLLRAARDVATAAHTEADGTPQDRKKIVQRPYMIHPFMAYDIVTRMGESEDAVMLASSLLHDALERDCYRTEPEQMQRDVEEALEREGLAPDRAQELADQVYHLVCEVTNPAVFPENKEVHQLDRVAEMTLRGKKLKIADQAASLIDNLLEPNNPALFPYRSETQFKDKANALVIKIVESVRPNSADKKALEPWESFFARCMMQTNWLFAAPHNATPDEIESHRQTVRANFDYNLLFEGPSITIRPVLGTVVHQLPFDDDKPVGLSRVDFDERGRVVNYVLHVSPDADSVHRANAIQQRMTHQVREQLRLASHYPESGTEPLRRAVLQPDELLQGDDGEVLNQRLYRISPHMIAASFAAAAKSAGACSHAQGKEIVDAAKRVADQHAETQRLVENAGSDRLRRLGGRGRDTARS